MWKHSTQPTSSGTSPLLWMFGGLLTPMASMLCSSGAMPCQGSSYSTAPHTRNCQSVCHGLRYPGGRSGVTGLHRDRGWWGSRSHLIYQHHPQSQSLRYCRVDPPLQLITLGFGTFSRHAVSITLALVADYKWLDFPKYWGLLHCMMGISMNYPILWGFPNRSLTLIMWA